MGKSGGCLLSWRASAYRRAGTRGWARRPWFAPLRGMVALTALLLTGWLPATAQGRPANMPLHGRADLHPGYLGVSLLDLDAETAARLHLKDQHGALIVTIDRDAPSATAGLRAHDVILELSGQRVENVEALRRKLRETPSGSTISLRISRDGAEQAVTVQLGDEAEIAQRAWEQHFSDAGNASAAGEQPGASASAPATSFVPPAGHGGGKGFLGHFALNALYTGAELDPLSTQLADFFGVHDGAGLLVRTVNENSPAAAAGLKAGDVILRVNNQLVVSREDWTKQLHANRGRPVQLSVMRNRREQQMTMMTGNGKKS